MRTISIYLRVTEHTTTEVTAQNRPKNQRSYIIRNQPVTLRIGIFRHEAAVAIMSKAELEAEGWKTWLLNISKNHTLSYPVYIQPDYDYDDKPITVSDEGFISVVLNTTDTEESAKAIKGMPGDMWEAELTGFAEEDTALETPLAILQWPIGYINRVADENADAPGLLESTYYTKEQVNELLRQIAPEGTWGHIIGDITDQEDLIALLEEKASKATTLGGYGITDAYTKTEIDAKVASVFHYKGSVNSYSDLPVSGMEVGDVYNVVNADTTHGIKAGDNVAWNGIAWDVLAGEIDLSGYIQTSEKDSPNGVAGLDANGKVKTNQLPSLDFIPNDEKGANNGVATLDATGKVPAEQLPTGQGGDEPLILDAPPTTATEGTVGKLALWHDANAADPDHADHAYHLVFISTSENATLYHWEECALLDSSGYVPSDKLRKAGNSWQGEYGVVRFYEYGIRVNSNGYAGIQSATNTLIDSKKGAPAGSHPIVPSNLDYAVRSVCKNITEIPSATSDYSLVDSSATTNDHSHTYSHVPTSEPTYRLPAVNNTAIAHYIELTVDFTNVQTYSFLDANGNDIVPLFTPSIAAGDIYTFKCEYSNIKGAWLIYPQKQGAVADDFVMRGEVGAANGVPSLNENAKVPSGQLPYATSNNNTFVAGVVYNAPHDRFNGLPYFESGKLKLPIPNATGIAQRKNLGTQFGGIIYTGNLNAAVTAAITDANHITLTDAQKKVAQEVFGVPAPLLGTTAPTTSTVGVVGQLYVDTVTSKTYHCTVVNVDDTDPNNVVTTYTWEDDVNANGGTFTGSIEVISLSSKDAYIYSTHTNAVAIGMSSAARQSSCFSAGIGADIQRESPIGFIALGKWTKAMTYEEAFSSVMVVGIGTSNSNRKNGIELSTKGDLYIAGGHQQGITVIPAATTSITLAEGVYSHSPTSPSTYTLPSVTDATRTHEIVVSVLFSASAMSCSFVDTDNNEITPLSTPEIEDGTVVSYLCSYEPLLSSWTVMPVVLGQVEAQP